MSDDEREEDHDKDHSSLPNLKIDEGFNQARLEMKLWTVKCRRQINSNVKLTAEIRSGFSKIGLAIKNPKIELGKHKVTLQPTGKGNALFSYSGRFGHNFNWGSTQFVCDFNTHSELKNALQFKITMGSVIISPMISHEIKKEKHSVEAAFYYKIPIKRLPAIPSILTHQGLFKHSMLIRYPLKYKHELKYQHWITRTNESRIFLRACAKSEKSKIGEFSGIIRYQSPTKWLTTSCQITRSNKWIYEMGAVMRMHRCLQLGVMWSKQLQIMAKGAKMNIPWLNAYQVNATLKNVLIKLMIKRKIYGQASCLKLLMQTDNQKCRTNLKDAFKYGIELSLN